MDDLGVAFGQQVSLVSRLREVLRNYPEGQAILYELLQNADDAGARVVHLSLDARTHPSQSLAFAGTAPYQGPALLAYNDRAFTDTDLASIQRVGDSLKRDDSRGGKTGRFGLGFNSVFHITDMPSFVTGSTLVLFDPALLANLPNVGPGNPGKLIDWIKQPKLKAFSDQINPYKLFGCDVAQRFEGTLFRLPLRTQEQAAASPISSRQHTPESIRALLKSFIGAAGEALLFLRSVEKIEVSEIGPENEIQLLYSVGIENCNAALRAQRSISLQSGGPEAPLRTFEYVLRIQTRDHVGNDSAFDREMRTWAVCQQLGRKSFSAALHPDVRHLKLIPFGGVAARISNESELSKQLVATGRAYVFLPLPLLTDLPVHVNGYFEISSNRRDIWWGAEDQLGEGRARAEWNKTLLSDVIGPAYARLLNVLAESSAMRSHPEQLMHLLPAINGKSLHPETPWKVLVAATFSALRSAQSPVLWSLPVQSLLSLWAGSVDTTSMVAQAPGRWVPIDDVVLLEEGGHNAVDYALQAVHCLLLLLGCQVVVLPHHSIATFRILGVGKGFVTPAFVRDHIRAVISAPSRPMTSWLALPRLPLQVLQYCMLDLRMSVDENCWSSLIGLPLLPLANGTFETFLKSSTAGPHIYALPHDSTMPVFLPCTVSILASKEALGEELKSLLTSTAVMKCTQLRRLTPADAGSLLRGFAPPGWIEAGIATVATKELALANVYFDLVWLRKLWAYLRLHAPELLEDFIRGADGLPLFPVDCQVSDNSCQTVRIVAATTDLKYCGIMAGSGLEEKVIEAIRASSVSVLDTRGTGEERVMMHDPSYLHQQAGRFIHPPNPFGFVAALTATRSQQLLVHGTKVVESLGRCSSAQLGDLRVWLLRQLSSRGLQLDDSDMPSLIATLRTLPLFSIESKTHLCASLTSEVVVYEVGLSFPREALALLGTFVALDADELIPTSMQVDAYSRLGCRVLRHHEFFTSYFLPHLGRLPIKTTCSAVRCMLQLLPDMIKVRPDFGSLLARQAFVPVKSGALFKPGDLFDPRVPELAALLEGSENCFPANELVSGDDDDRNDQNSQDLESSAILNVLRSLGMQCAMSRQAVLAAAISVSKSALSGPCTRAAFLAGTMRAVRLLEYIDAHANTLFARGSGPPSAIHTRSAEKKRDAGFFGRVGGLLKSASGSSSDKEVKETEARMASEAAAQLRRIDEVEAAAFVNALRDISWMPVWSSPPDAALPWPISADSESSVLLDLLPPLVSPKCVRPSEDAWLCSAVLSRYRLICTDAQGHCSALFDGVQPEVPPEGRRWSNGFEWFMEWESRKLIGQAAAMQLAALSRAWYDGQSRAVLALRCPIVVPTLYGVMSAALNDPGSGIQDIASVLHTCSPVWLGVNLGFVTVTAVAFSAPRDASPYLNILSSDLLPHASLFRAMGVRERFGRSDYLGVLRLLANEGSPTPLAGQPEKDAKPIAHRPLSKDMLHMAVAMVQQLADIEGQSDADGVDVHVALQGVLVPDAACCLAPAQLCAFDDAPWLSDEQKSGSDSIVGIAQTNLRFVHPLISNSVAAALGVVSLRSTLLSQSGLTQLDVPSEAFGQSEPLTRRLRHILEQYAEGPGVLYEMLQNADDAGASRVSVLLDLTSHKTGSLLSPQMALLQGPALYVYNDATFSQADFLNLARLGQGSKLEKLNTTGRYGLGFNACFHITDVPTVVSADSVVFFDPHTSHVPGATTAQPGIRIRFAQVPGTDASRRSMARPGALLSRFPDQFEPFCIFGNDMIHPYNGTLFRFPLRAGSSEIKSGAVDTAVITNLIESFREASSRCLLFLRSVCRVQVFMRGEGQEQPRLLYEAVSHGRGSGLLSSDCGHRLDPEPDSQIIGERTYRDLFGMDETAGLSETDVQPFLAATERAAERWQAIPNFLVNGGVHGRVITLIPRDGPGSKDAFYNHLLALPQTSLPRETHLIRITRVDYAYRSRDDGSDQRRSSCTMAYIVHTRLGAGRARAMACDPAHCDLKFLPWAAVAARLAVSYRTTDWEPFVEESLLLAGTPSMHVEDGSLLNEAGTRSPESGRAFVFLPLPAHVSLPVHINGYFEISSNRRDIWTGSDMSGKGRIRAQWNSVMLADVVAPAYGRMLLETARLLSRGTGAATPGADPTISPAPALYPLTDAHIGAYYALWPSTLPPEPWSIVANRLLSLAVSVPLLYTKCSAEAVNQWTASKFPENLRANRGRLLVSSAEGLQSPVSKFDTCWIAPRDAVLLPDFNLDEHVLVWGQGTQDQLPFSVGANESDVQLGQAVSMADFLAGPRVDAPPPLTLAPATILTTRLLAVSTASSHVSSNQTSHALFDRGVHGSNLSGTNGGEQRSRMTVPSSILACLRSQNVPLVSLPTALYNLMLSASMDQLHVSQAFIRSYFRLDDASIASVCNSRETEKNSVSANAIITDNFPSLKDHTVVSSILAYASSDLGNALSRSGARNDLHGLPFLPLMDGTLGVVVATTFPQIEKTHAVFLCNSPSERALFEPIPWRAIDASSAASVSVLACEPVLAELNLRRISDSTMTCILEILLPPSWAARSTVAWNPESDDPGCFTLGKHPSISWFRALWSILGSRSKLSLKGLVHAVNPGDRVLWPLLPVFKLISGQEKVRFLLQLVPGSPVVHPGDIPVPVLQFLASAGVYTLDEDCMPRPCHADLVAGKYIQEGSAAGSIRALLCALRPVSRQLHGSDSIVGHTMADAAAAIDPADVGLGQTLLLLPGMLSNCSARERRTFREYLAEGLQSPSRSIGSARDVFASAWKWKSGEAVSALEILAMRCLPLYDVFGSEEQGGEQPLTPLISQVFLAPTSMPEKVLGPSFIRVANERQAYLVQCLGVELLTEERVWRQHIFPNLVSFSAYRRSIAAVAVLSRCADLDEVARQGATGSGQPSVFSAVLRATCFVPTPSGRLCRPSELYDPSVRELTELLPSEYFPAAVADVADTALTGSQPSLHSSEALASLRLLGLQTELTVSAIVESAERICRDNSVWAIGMRSLLSSDVIDIVRRGELDGLATSVLDRAKNLLRLLEAGSLSVSAVLMDPAASLKLKTLAWLPVLLKAPNELLPWYVADVSRTGLVSGLALPDAQGGMTGNSLGPALTLVLPPMRTRPIEAAWSCSGCMGILDGRISREEFVKLFGWLKHGAINSPVPAVDIAKQIVAISSKYSSSCHARISGSVEASVAASVSSRTFASLLLAVPQLFCDLSDLLGFPRTSSAVRRAADENGSGGGVTDVNDLVEAQTARATDHSGDLDTDALEAVSRILAGRPWVFTGDDFVPAQRVAVLCPPGSKPFLYAVHLTLEPVATMLQALGVQSEFGVDDLIRALHALPVGIPLPIHQLDFAVALVNTLGTFDDQFSSRETSVSARRVERGSRAWQACVARAAPLFVPGLDGVMKKSNTLVVNDAPWLSSSIAQGWEGRLVHPRVTIEAAQALGVPGLRSLVLGTQAATSILQCAGVAPISALLSESHYAATGATFFADVAELADILGAEGVGIVWDGTTHGTTSLVCPGLSSLQGPAITLVLLGVRLKVEEVLPLFDPAQRLPPKPAASATFRPLLCGPGLLSSFFFADAIQVLTGGRLIVVDPMRAFLESSGSGVLTSNSGGLCGSYQLSTGDESLINRFPDQFAAFKVLQPAMAALSRSATIDPFQSACTLIRLPLRKEPSALGRVCMGKNGIIEYPSPLVFGVQADRQFLDSVAANINQPAGSASADVSLHGFSIVAAQTPVSQAPNTGASVLLQHWSATALQTLPLAFSVEIVGVYVLARGVDMVVQTSKLVNAEIRDRVAARLVRQRLLLDMEWQRFKLSSIFTGYNPPRESYVLDISVSGACMVPHALPDIERECVLNTRPVKKEMKIVAEIPVTDPDADSDGFPMLAKSGTFAAKQTAVADAVQPEFEEFPIGSPLIMTELMARYVERWTVQSVLGCGRTRELALSTPGLDTLQVSPLVTLAAPVLRITSSGVVCVPSLCLSGSISCNGAVMLTVPNGLPAHIRASFILDPITRSPAVTGRALSAEGVRTSGVALAPLDLCRAMGRQGIAGAIEWNKSLLSVALRDVFPLFIASVRDTMLGAGNPAAPGGPQAALPTSQLKNIYRYFPLRSKLPEVLAQCWPVTLWSVICEQEVFAVKRNDRATARGRTARGSFLPLSGCYIQPSNLPIPAATWICAATDTVICDMPQELAAELLAAPNSPHFLGLAPPPQVISAAFVRTLVQRQLHVPGIVLSAETASCLLAYCLSDVVEQIRQRAAEIANVAIPRASFEQQIADDVTASLVGLRLLPLADGSFGVVGGCTARPGQDLRAVRAEHGAARILTEAVYLLEGSLTPGQPGLLRLLPHWKQRFVLCYGVQTTSSHPVLRSTSLVERLSRARDSRMRITAQTTADWTLPALLPINNACPSLFEVFNSDAIMRAVGLSIATPAHVSLALRQPTCAILPFSMMSSLHPTCMPWVENARDRAPKASWIALFWRQFNFADSACTGSFGTLPLIPLLPGPVQAQTGCITSARLLSCTLSAHALVVWEGACDAGRASALQLTVVSNVDADPTASPSSEVVVADSTPAARIHSLLQRCGVPLLDAAYLPPMSRPAPLTAEQIAPAVLHALAAIQGSVGWSLVSATDRNALLRLFGSHARRNGNWASADLVMIKQLPLFQTIQGTYEDISGGAAFIIQDQAAADIQGMQPRPIPPLETVDTASLPVTHPLLPPTPPASNINNLGSLMQVSAVARVIEEAGVFDAFRNGAPAPPRRGHDANGHARDHFLATIADPLVSALYTELGVKVLSESQLCARYILPSCPALPAGDAYSVMSAIRDRWVRLRADNDVILAATSLKWLCASRTSGGESVIEGSLYPASALLHPEHRLAAQVALVAQRCGVEGSAEGDGHSLLFPADRFSSSDWWPFLIEIGLRVAFDEATVLTAARTLSACAVQNVHSRVPQDVADTAYYLLRAGWDGEVSVAGLQPLLDEISSLRSSVRPSINSNVSAVITAGSSLMAGVVGSQLSLGQVAQAARDALASSAAPPPAHQPGNGAQTVRLQTAGVSDMTYGVPIQTLRRGVTAFGLPREGCILPTAGAILCSPDALRRIADMAIVPSYMPSMPGYLYAPAPWQIGGIANSAAASVASNGPILARFRECILPADSHLAWTVLPVLPNSLLPSSEGAGSALGITSPPSRPIVVRHMQNLGSGRYSEVEEERTSSQSQSAGPVCLDMWPYCDVPTAVYSSLFRWLDGPLGFAAMSADERSTLSTLPVVPVGNFLYPVSMVFMQLEEGAYPLLVEVPRAFGRDALFHRMGVESTPTLEHCAGRLRALHRGACGLTLEPNELRAAIGLVQLLSRTTSGLPTNVPLPNSEGSMSDMSECLFSDDPWLATRLQTAISENGSAHAAGLASSQGMQFRLVHPALGVAPCSSLQVRKLSDAVGELLSGTTPVQGPNSQVAARIEDALHLCIRSEGTARLVSSLVATDDSEPAAADCAHDLAAVTVRVVDTIVVQLGVRNANRVYEAAHGTEELPAFYPSKEEGKTILFLALETCATSGLDVSTAVARGIAEILQSGSHPKNLAGDAHLAATLRKAMGGIPIALPHVSEGPDTEPGRALRIPVAGGYARLSQALLRGKPGFKLIDMDACPASLRIAPGRVFLRFDIVAIPSGNSSGSPRLVYGRIDSVATGQASILSTLSVACSASLTSSIMRTESSKVYVFTTAEERARRLPAVEREAWLAGTIGSLRASSGYQLGIGGAVGPSTTLVRPLADRDTAPAALAAMDDSESVRAVQAIMGRMGMRRIGDSEADSLARVLTLQTEIDIARARATLAEAEAARLKAEIASNSLAASRLCNICLSADVDSVLVPCGHAICSTCARSLPRAQCPFDRARVTQLMPLYF